MTEPGIARDLAALYARRAHGIKLGLEPIRLLLDELGNPQKAFPAVHVAGTNGKGSVCAMVDAVLREAGVSTGLYTSPHLVHFGERIRINGCGLDKKALGGLLHDVLAADARAAARPGGREATFFEFTTAMAFEQFRRADIACAVLETGLGGRLDATTLCEPVVTAITSIGLDHTGYLGETLPQVAREKCGIVKPGCPLVYGPVPTEAEVVIREIARLQRAPAVPVGEVVSIRRIRQELSGQKLKVESPGWSPPPFVLPLLGEHQVANAAVAVALLEQLNDLDRFAVSEQDVVAGMSSVAWPGRLQVVEEAPLLLVDSAHNPAGAHALCRALAELGDEPLGFVVGFSADKDAAGFLAETVPHTQRTWLVHLQHERAMSAVAAQEAARMAGIQGDVLSLPGALDAARAWAREGGGHVCVAGSIFLVGELFELLGREVSNPTPSR